MPRFSIIYLLNQRLSSLLPSDPQPELPFSYQTTSRLSAGQVQRKVALACQACGLRCPALAANPLHTWEQLLPGASSEDTRFLLFVQIFPTIVPTTTTRGTNLERKALTSPCTCSSLSFLMFQLCWQKKPASDPICTMEKKINTANHKYSIISNVKKEKYIKDRDMHVKYASYLRFLLQHSLAAEYRCGLLHPLELPALLLPTLPTHFSRWAVQVRPSPGTGI